MIRSKIPFNNKPAHEGQASSMNMWRTNELALTLRAQELSSLLTQFWLDIVSWPAVSLCPVKLFHVGQNNQNYCSIIRILVFLLLLVLVSVKQYNPSY